MRSLPLALALLALPALAQDPAPKELRSQRGREIKSLVEALGSEQFQAREAARARLVEIGPEALPWLERAADDPDPERAAAATELVRTLRWLVPADLRGLVQELLDDFPGQSAQRRGELVLQVFRLGAQAGPAFPWLVTVARFDPDPGVRLVAVEVYLHLSPTGTPERDGHMFSALADEAESPRVLLARGRLHRRLGRGAEAIAAAERAFELDPTARPARALLIELLVDGGQVERALPLAEADVTTSPNDPDARIRLGELLLLAGREAEGVAALTPVEELATQAESRDLLLRLVRAWLRGKQPARAEKLLRTALGRFPYDHQLNVAMGDLHAATGKSREALETWLSELGYAAPGSGPYLELVDRLARLLVELGAPEEAARDESLWLDAQRGRPLRDVRVAVATWLRGRGLFEDAARELRLACALAPGEVALRRVLGEVLAEGGRYEEARAAFQAALALAPDDARAKARLAELAGQTSSSGGPREAERCAFWEQQIDAGELERAAESVPGETAPPLVVGGMVLAPVPGTTRIYGFSAQDGRIVWSAEVTPPPPVEGALPEQMGLEPIGLVTVPPAVLAATNPTRARSRVPLAALIANVYWRPAHRSWRAASWKGVRAHLFDPESGQELLVQELDLGGQVLAPAPVSRRGRALLCVSPRQKRRELALLDLVTWRTLWRARAPLALTRPPRFAGEQVVLAWPDGVLGLTREGKLAWEHMPGKDVAEPEDGAPPPDGPPPPPPFTTGPGVGKDGVLVGTADGRVVSVDSAGAARELLRPVEGRLTGDLVVEGERAYVAERGGAVVAIALAGEGAPKVLWKGGSGKAAERQLAWAGGLLFAHTGHGDLYDDEVPGIQGLDPQDGKVVFQRQAGRPATMAAGEGLLAVVSGGRGSRGGMQVVVVQPAKRFDPVKARLEELRSACQAALAEGQAEVAAVVGRVWVTRLGGIERLDKEGLVLFARVLGRSNRRDEALDAICLGEVRAAKGDQATWDGLRKELGLEPPPEEKKPAEAPQKPDDAQKPPEGPKPPPGG